MKPRYRLFKRGNRFYKRDTETNLRTSLGTSCRKAAQKLVDAENQSHESPALSYELAKAYLTSSDPLAKTRTWSDVMEEYARKGAPQTQDRKRRVFAMREFDFIRGKLLISTVAEDFFAVLRSEKVSVNVYLVQLQNLAVDVGWLPRPVIPRRSFPVPKKKRKIRAITREVHARVIAAENSEERRLYYSLLWEIGASQTDAARLRAENFDLTRGLLMFERSKTEQLCRMQMGLYRDDRTGRWGVPEGETPTTHILKPNEGRFADHDQNEHYCLTLARLLGMAAAESWIERIGEIPVIIVKRFDRVPLEGKISRVHQEDTCQALGTPPLQKYERDGGPTAGDIFGLIRDYSSNPREDEHRFLDALIYNWLIKGTDAHGKNFGFLLAAGPQVRLAPLYDVASFIPYETPHQERKTRMAMKIGGEYQWWKIGPQHWERAAKEWKLDRDRVFTRITDMAARMPAAVAATRAELESAGIGLTEGIARLEGGISTNAAATGKLYTPS